jgi:hypothetical protein
MLPVEIYEEEEVEISPLSADENKRRAVLEAVIEKNFKAFVEVGLALKEIRELKLYRSTHKTWGKYCIDLWDMNRAHADRLISAHDVVENLAPIGAILPKNEAQARPLTLIEDPEKQKEIWQSIVSNAPEGRITASLVERAVRDVRGEEKTERRKETQRRMAKEEQMDYEVKRYFRDFFQVIDEAKHDKWKKTSKEAILKYLDEMKRVVLEA